MAENAVPSYSISAWRVADIERHRSRIYARLRTFLAPHEAEETTTRVYNLAVETETEIGRILRDPMVHQLYAYDGQFFTARHMRLFHTAFDGVHVLQSLGDSNLQAFFRGIERRAASRRLLDSVGIHAWTARVRRMNWEGFQTLGLLPPALLDEALIDAIAARGEAPTAMSLEEQSFFRPFEKQMI